MSFSFNNQEKHFVWKTALFLSFIIGNQTTLCICIIESFISVILGFYANYCWSLILQRAKSISSYVMNNLNFYELRISLSPFQLDPIYLCMLRSSSFTNLLELWNFFSVYLIQIQEKFLCRSYDIDLLKIMKI